MVFYTQKHFKKFLILKKNFLESFGVCGDAESLLKSELVVGELSICCEAENAGCDGGKADFVSP